MNTRDIQPMIDAEIDAVTGGTNGSDDPAIQPIGWWDEWRPPWWNIGGGLPTNNDPFAP